MGEDLAPRLDQPEGPRHAAERVPLRRRLARGFGAVVREVASLMDMVDEEAAIRRAIITSPPQGAPGSAEHDMWLARKEQALGVELHLARAQHDSDIMNRWPLM